MSPARAPFADLDDILLSTQHLLLSFDGAVCDLSSALQDISACDHLRNAITERGFPLPADVIETTDPLEVLSYAADADRDMAIRLESELTQLETRAAADAALTPHVHDVVNACRESGRSVTIISQNAIRAVKLYLNAHDLARIGWQHRCPRSRGHLESPPDHTASRARGQRPQRHSILMCPGLHNRRSHRSSPDQQRLQRRIRPHLQRL